MSQPDEAPCLQQFFSWAKSERRFSTAFPDSDEEIFFNSIPTIEAYFKARNHEKLNVILAALFEAEGEAPPGIAEVIVKGYVAVFCTLLYTGKGRHIKNFVEYELHDGLLPFWPTHPPPNFPNSSDQSFFEKFCEEQWRFCCPILSRDSLYNRHFPENRVLPIADKQRVGAGGSAELFKIRIHDGYNQLDLGDTMIRLSPANTFVLKTYVSGDAERNYNNEVAVFQRLAGVRTLRKLSYIIGYYGSFTHGKKHNIILEYADKGDLEKYFMTVEPPQTAEDILSFWGGMFNLLRALMDIHISKQQSSPDAPAFQGLHQDVKPQNILVVSNEETSPSKWLFKLGDLGLTQFQKSTSWDGGTTIEGQGTRTYGAPECYRDNDLWAAQLSITPKADIWSLGCIYSEGARWVATGQAGLRDYRNNRLYETRKIPDFEDGNCFHDGEKALRTVRDSNKATISKLHEQDPITHRVLGMADDMLDSDPENRPAAKQLWEKAQKLLAEARNELNSRVSHSATISSISSAASGNTMHPPLPPVLPYSFIPPSPYWTSPDNIDNQPTKTPSPPPLNGHIQSSNVNRNGSVTPNPLVRSNTYSPSSMNYTPITRSETTNGKMMESSYLEGSSVDQATNLRTRQGNFENRNREADTTMVNSHGRTGSVDPYFPSTSVSSRDSKNMGDSPNKKKLSQKTQPCYCFSANGNKLVVWAKSARKFSIYDVKGGSCLTYDAVDVRLAAAGEEYYTMVSETGNYESLHVHQVSDGTLVTSVPLESAAVSIAMSGDDRFVALGIFNKVVVYNARDLSERWIHALPPTDDRESKCERVWFSTDGSKILAARRTKRGIVYPYISDCQNPTTTYKIPSINNPQGHYQDFGVSSILHDNKSGFACVTAYASKMPPTLFSLQSTPRRDSLDWKDLTDLGTEIQCAAIHPSQGRNQFMLVNSENNIFSVQRAPTGRWQVGKICKLPLNETLKKSEMTVIAMPTPNTIYAFRIQGDERILITVRISDRKPATSSRDISDKLRI